MGVLILLYLLILGLVLWGLTKISGRPRPTLECPNCKRIGKFRFWGRFHCTNCGHDFIADHTGKIMPNSIKLFLVKLCFDSLLSLVIFTAFFCFCVDRRDFTYAFLILPSVLWGQFFPLMKKNFPSDS